MKMILIALCGTLLLADARASEVSFAPLTNIVHQAASIIKGKVLETSTTNTEAGRTIQYIIRPTAVIAGKPCPLPRVLLRYSESSPAIKDKGGKIIGWASPIYSGSGKEFSIKPGEERIFMLVANEVSADKVTAILRVEPQDAEQNIRDIKSQPTDAAAASRGQ